MLRVLVIAVMFRRGFQPSHLGAALVAMISLASGVWILLFDDLSSVIFRQPTEPPKVFDILWFTGTDFEILWTLVEFILLLIGLTII